MHNIKKKLTRNISLQISVVDLNKELNDFDSSNTNVKILYENDETKIAMENDILKQVNFKENKNYMDENNEKGLKVQTIQNMNSKNAINLGSTTKNKNDFKKLNSLLQNNLSWKNDIKAAKWFSIVLLCFAICWLPLITLNCMTVLNNIVCVDCLPFAVLLSHLNSTLNPILYAFGNSKFTKAFKNMLGLKSNKVANKEDDTAY